MTAEERRQAAYDKAMKQFEKEAADIAFDEAVKAKLPEGNPGLKVRTHRHGLYGSAGSVKIEPEYYYPDGAPSTADRLAYLVAVAEALPGLPMVKVTGTYTSYLAAAQLPAYESDGRNKVEIETPLAPWVVEGEGDYGRGSSCTLKWVAEIEGVGLIRVEFVLPYLRAVRYAARRVDYVGGHRYEDERIEVNDRAYTIFDGDDTPVAELSETTRWAGGGSEYPRRVTKGWGPLDDTNPPRTVDFARALQASHAAE